MKKRGIRFFNKIKFSNVEYVKFHRKREFLQLLNKRKQEFDITLILAHGAPDCILTTTNDIAHPYKRYINITDTTAFVNNFIFAVSCDTANEFGQESICNGAIAYLGYEVKIEKIFSTQGINIPHRVSIAFDTIIKHIFIEELALSLEKFTHQMMSVQLLKEYFSFSVETRISKLQEMSEEEIFEEYNVKIKTSDYTRYTPEIILKELVELGETARHLICLGDENYFYYGFIEQMRNVGESSSKIIAHIKNSTFFQQMQHQPYKDFLIKVATYV